MLLPFLLLLLPLSLLLFLVLDFVFLCHFVIAFLSVPPLLLPLSLLFVIVIIIALSVLSSPLSLSFRHHCCLLLLVICYFFFTTVHAIALPLLLCIAVVFVLAVPLRESSSIFVKPKNENEKQCVSVAETFHFFRFRVFGFTKLLFSNPVTQLFHCFILSVVDYYCCCFYEE